MGCWPSGQANAQIGAEPAAGRNSPANLSRGWGKRSNTRGLAASLLLSQDLPVLVRRGSRRGASHLHPFPSSSNLVPAKERTGRNWALRFPRPPCLPAEVLPTRLWLLNVRLFRHLSLDARIFSFLRVIRHSFLAIGSTKVFHSFLSLCHPNGPFGAHALLLS